MKAAGFIQLAAVAFLMGSGSSAQAACEVNGYSSICIQNPRPNSIVVNTTPVDVYFTETNYSDRNSQCSADSIIEIAVDNRVVDRSGYGQLYGSSYRFNLNTRLYADGVHRLTATINDRLGRSSTTSINVLIRNNFVRPEVFDLNFYAEVNPDVKAAFGGNSEQILLHWLYYGAGEGRIASPAFLSREYMLLHTGC